MHIAIGSDHRGFSLKGRLALMLRAAGHAVSDLGTHSADACDYPDYAAAVARQVAAGQAERGILICGTGIGVCMAANKIAGVRAGVCHDEQTAELSRQHNDLNVLCLSAGAHESQQAIPPEPIVRTWLATPFEGGRHARRVEKVKALEGTRESPCTS